MQFEGSSNHATRIMVTFLAVCLRSACNARDHSERSVELRLCTLLLTQLSIWSLDVEMCPIELTAEQGQRLYDTGMEFLVPNTTKCCCC